MLYNTVLCAAFCGTGKSYLCDKFIDKYIEFECYKYVDGNFPNNYINDIQCKMGEIPYIFISTNPIVLKELNGLGHIIYLVHPNIDLKNEYIRRYFNRGSSDNFIKILDKHWYNWLSEIKDQNYCKQIILNSGEYLQDILYRLKIGG